jgi:MoaA/NifB/PqqE/SkfB family radical SAM enzyme
MTPFLRDGDVLRVAAVAWEDLARGDLVTYRLPGHLPTLRVAARHGDQLALVADNRPGRTFQVWREHLVGRVVARTREGATLTRESPAWRLHRHLWLRRRQAAGLAARAARVLRGARRGLRRRPLRYDRPPNVQLNVSAACNLACRMCPYLGVHGNPAHLEFMAPETFERMLPTIREIGAVHFSGSGEPLFHRGLLDFMARVREVAPRARIDLTTNGTLLTRAVAGRLIDLGLTKLHVSFDGLPRRAETIRRRLNGDKVLDNVRALGDLKRARGSRGPLVQVNYMTGYGTYWDLVAFIELAHAIGVAEIQLLEMQPATAEDAAGNLLNSTREDGGRVLRTAVMLAQHLDLRLHLPTITPGACHFPANPHVGEDGTVYPCCYLDYDGRQLFDGAPHRFEPVRLGNVNAAPFEALWRAPGYRAFRERNARGDFDATCATCYRVRLATSQRIEELLRPPRAREAPAGPGPTPAAAPGTRRPS